MSVGDPVNWFAVIHRVQINGHFCCRYRLDRSPPYFVSSLLLLCKVVFKEMLLCLQSTKSFLLYSSLAWLTLRVRHKIGYTKFRVLRRTVSRAAINRFFITCSNITTTT